MPRSPVALVFALSATLFAAFALNAGASLQSSLLALRASSEGFAPIAVGLIMASYYIGFIGGILWGAGLVNRVGHIRTFTALASTGSAVSLLYAIFVDPITWALFRAMTGLCISALYLVIESWLNEQADNTSRGSIIAAYLTASLAGLAAGQMMLTASPINGFELFTLSSVLLSLCLVPIALTRQPPPATVHSARMKFRELYNISPLGFVAAAGSGILTAAVYTVGPIFAAELGLETREVATFMAAIIVGGMVMQWPIGRLSDVVPRQYVMIAVLAGLAITAIVPLIMREMILDNLWVWGIFLGVFVMPVYGLAVAYVNDYLQPQQIVSASGGLLIIYGASAAGGPLLGSVFIGYFGPWAMPAMFAVVAILVGGFAFYRAGFGRRISIEEQGQFVAVPRTSPIALELSPVTDAPADGSTDGKTGTPDADDMMPGMATQNPATNPMDAMDTKPDTPDTPDGTTARGTDDGTADTSPPKMPG